jgi:hypothetical protein
MVAAGIVAPRDDASAAMVRHLGPNPEVTSKPPAGRLANANEARKDRYSLPEVDKLGGRTSLFEGFDLAVLDHEL